VKNGIDFPALRESLKEQLNARMADTVPNETKDNVFAALSGMFAGAVVDRMVDMIVTPQGILNLSRGKGPRGAAEFANLLVPDQNHSYAFESSDRFVVRLGDEGRTVGKLIWKRSGLITWSPAISRCWRRLPNLSWRSLFLVWTAAFKSGCFESSARPPS